MNSATAAQDEKPVVELPTEVNATDGARPERRIAVNSGLLLAAFAFQAVVSLVMVGVVARSLGQAGLGRYAYVISFIELFIAFVDMGMNRIQTREISKQPDQVERFTSAVWTVRLALSLAVMGVVAVVAAQHGDRSLWLAIMVYFFAQVLWLLGDVYNSVFQGFQRMEYQFWTLNLNQALLLLLTLGVAWLNLGLVAFFAVRLVVNAVKLVLVAWISRRRYTQAHWLPGVLPGAWVALSALPRAVAVWPRHGRAAAAATVAARGRGLGPLWQDALLAWRMFTQSLPVGVSLILRSYIWRAGIVLTVLWLGQAQGDLVNGALYGPLRAVQQLRIVPVAFTTAMLPVLSYRAGGDTAQFDSTFTKSFKFFVALGALIALGCTFLADPLMKLLLGNNIDLAAAAQVLAILGWVVVIYFPNWLYGTALVALGRQKVETLGLVLGLAGGFLVARGSVPTLQAAGVAYAILAAEAIIFLISTIALWRRFRWRHLVGSLLKIGMAGVATALAFTAGITAWHQAQAAGLAPTGTLGALAAVVLVGGAGAALYIALLLLLRTFQAEELANYRAALRRS